MTPPPGASASAARAGTLAPQPLRLPPAPRRLSGPSRRPVAVPAARSSLWVRVIDHPWLDRLVRGRLWIAVVATALLGIVAMQVALLRLGAQIGSTTEQVNSLIARNEATQATIGEIEASSRLSREASSLGMVYPAPGSITYLQVNPGDARRAADRMTTPSSAAAAAAAAHPLISPTHTATRSSGPATSATPPPSGATGNSGAAAGTIATGTGAAQTTPTQTAAGGTATSTAGAGNSATTTTTPTTNTAGTGNSATTTTTPTTNTAGTSTPATTTPATTAAGGTAAPATTATGATASGP